MRVLLLILIAVIAYGLGGVNGAIVTSMLLHRKDVRKFGSGNAGLTNYYRTFGGAGVAIVIAIDILKAVIAVLLGGALLGLVGLSVVGKLFAGFCLILGHMYPAFHNFKGGKGALCGEILALMVDWRVGLIMLIVFVVVIIFTRYVSLGSMLAALMFPIMLWTFGYETLEGVLGLLCALLVIVKHGENILRLIGGTESKLNLKGKSVHGPDSDGN